MKLFISITLMCIFLFPSLAMAEEANQGLTWDDLEFSHVLLVAKSNAPMDTSLAKEKLLSSFELLSCKDMSRSVEYLNDRFANLCPEFTITISKTASNSLSEGQTILVGHQNAKNLKTDMHMEQVQSQLRDESRQNIGMPYYVESLRPKAVKIEGDILVFIHRQGVFGWSPSRESAKFSRWDMEDWSIELDKVHVQGFSAKSHDEKPFPQEFAVLLDAVCKKKVEVDE